MNRAPTEHPRLERLWPFAPLRRYLVAMIVLATLPLSVWVGFQLYRDVREEQAEIDASLAQSAAALSQAVENELVASLDALTALSHSELLQRHPAEFERALRLQPRPRRDWQGVFLLDANGRLLFDTAGQQAGAAVGELAQLHEKVLRRSEPVVSGLVDGASVVLAVPVLQADRVRYVLGARIDNLVWQRLLGTASRPQDGHALLHDAGHRLVGSTLSDEVAAGAMVPADLVEAMRGGPFGVQRAAGADGRPVYTSWQQVPVSGWTVQVAVPAAPIDAGHRRRIVAAFLASGGSLLLGVLLAAFAARAITRPLQKLAVEGHAGLPGRVPVQEVAMLRDALRRAAVSDERVRQALEKDIAERKHVEAELLAAHEQLRGTQQLMELAQEAGHVGFFHYRFEPDELVWTRGHCKLFGIDELQGSGLAHWFDRIVEGDRARVEREFWTACALRRETETLEYSVRRPDGRMRWLSSRVLLRYSDDGAARQMTGVTVDMSDQREAELQRAHLTERALAARQQAEAASRAKDEFLSMLGHELRNPLGAISAAIDVLDLAVPGSPGAAEARAIISRQTRNLAHMMNDLLDVGRVIAGKILIARQPVNLANTFERVWRTLDLTREAAGHDIHRCVEDAWVDGDAVRIEQVMTNLVTNAIKYTPAGRRIEVVVARQGGDAVFEVKDAGMGIPATLLPHIFDLFVQGERPLDRGAGGLGIGLTLVRRLVELHNGTIRAESSQDGSRFIVRLPAIDPPSRPEGDTLPPSRRRRVLVIDDNADVLAALRSKLELDGHTVSTAADGIDGLTHLLRQQPEVSIVDIGLPGLTGYELARHARAAGYAGRMIALSGYGHERDVNDALVAGFDAYLVKPVDRVQLRASLSAD